MIEMQIIDAETLTNLKASSRQAMSRPYLGWQQRGQNNSRPPNFSSRRQHFLEEPRHGDLVLAIGALLGRILRLGECVQRAAVDIELPVDLCGSQLLDDSVDLGERRHRIFGAVQDEDAA